MKRAVLYVLIGFFPILVGLTGCFPVENEKKIHRERVVNRYTCPMKCTEQIFDEPGKCPKCGMDLVKITEG